MLLRTLAAGLLCVFLATAQNTEAPPPDEPAGGSAEQAEDSRYVVDTGTRIPLAMINSISTKHAAEGDRVYLETVFPILSDGHIVIPPGSYVAGTVTTVKRPGRVKGRGELYVRFDSLTLPNGVTRDFRARIGTMDGRAEEELDRDEGTIRSDGNAGGDARTIGESTAAGASAGTIAGAIGGNAGMGAGIGAAAGATAGLIGVLLSRGPEATLAKGTTVEMVLDRPLAFTDEEIDFGPMYRPRSYSGDGDGPVQRENSSRIPIPGGRLPF